MTSMTSGLLTSIATFFATIGPVEAAVVFATLTPNLVRADRTRLAAKATFVAGLILLAATLFGGPVLRQLGVSLPALQTAGGIILLMISMDMIFARPTSAFKLTPPEGAEAQAKDDLAIFPIATPLLAGPGAMSAAIVLAATAHGDATSLGLVVAALVVVMLVTLALLVAAHEISRVLGATAQRVSVRVFGILLSAIAVQAIFNGVGASGLIGAS